MGGLLDAGGADDYAMLPVPRLEPAREPPRADVECKSDCITRPATASTTADGSRTPGVVAADDETDVAGRELALDVTGGV